MEFSGKYDMNKTAILISQTGGGCRASNYIGFIRRALEKAGYPNVPVISINLSGLESNPGFTFTPKLIQRTADESDVVTCTASATGLGD